MSEDKVAGEVTPTGEATPQAKTYTQEQVDAFLGEAKKSGFDEAWNKYQGLQRVVTDKDLKIKELQRAAQSQPTGQTDDKLLAVVGELEAIARGGSDVDSQTRLMRLKNQIEDDREKEKQRKSREEQIAWQQKVFGDEREKLNKQITDAGLDPEDPMFDTINLAARLAYLADGDFEDAHKRLDRIIKKAKPPEVKEVPKETEEKIKERLEREILEKHGLTGKEKASPSGGSLAVSGMTREKVKDLMKTPEGRKWFKEHEDELIQASFQGKIK